MAYLANPDATLSAHCDQARFLSRLYPRHIVIVYERHRHGPAGYRVLRRRAGDEIRPTVMGGYTLTPVERYRAGREM